MRLLPCIDIYIYRFICLHHNWWLLQIGKRPVVNIGQTATPGTPCPSLFLVCGSCNVPQFHTVICNKGCGTRPPAYSPFPRRLESLTICWFKYKGSAFYSVILRAWGLVQPESRMTARCSTNWTTSARYTISFDINAVHFVYWHQRLSLAVFKMKLWTWLNSLKSNAMV